MHYKALSGTRMLYKAVSRLLLFLKSLPSKFGGLEPLGIVFEWFWMIFRGVGEKEEGE